MSSMNALHNRIFHVGDRHFIWLCYTNLGPENRSRRAGIRDDLFCAKPAPPTHFQDRFCPMAGRRVGSRWTTCLALADQAASIAVAVLRRHGRWTDSLK